jgi:hypothetical protein
MLQQRRVEVAPVGELGPVELLEQAGLDLHLGEVRAGHDDVVARLARHQLAVQDLVGVVVVVVDLDAGLLLEILQRVVGDVVRPVVDVEHLGLRRSVGGGREQGCGEAGRDGEETGQAGRHGARTPEGKGCGNGRIAPRHRRPA